MRHSLRDLHAPLPLPLPLPLPVRCRVLRQEIHSFSFGRSVVVDNQRRPPRSQAAIETIASSYVEDVPKVRLFNLSPDTKIAVRTVLYYSIH